MRICLESCQGNGRHVKCCVSSPKLSYSCAYRIKTLRRLFNRKATSSRNIHTAAEEETAGAKFYEDLSDAIIEYDVYHQKFVVNFDQVCQSLAGGHRLNTLAKIGQQEVLIAGQDNNKKTIALVVGGIADGRLLPLQAIFDGKTDRCHPKNFSWPAGFSITHNTSHWSTSETSVKYIQDILKPYFNDLRHSATKYNEMSGIVLMDAFAGQNTQIVLAALREINCVPVLVPRGFTYKFQPMDQAPDRALKANILKQREEHMLQRVREGLPRNWEDARFEDLGALMQEIKVGAQGSKTQFAQWVCNAFKQVDYGLKLVQSSFVETGIANVVTVLMQEEECTCLHD